MMKKLTILKSNFILALILFFALTGITTTNTAKAQQNIRDQFLVDKIYGSTSDGTSYLNEFIYDEDNRLIKNIGTNYFFEQGRWRDGKYVFVFEYENGRVSKMMHYDSTHFMFDFSIHLFYNTQGQLIRSEGYMDGSMYEHINYYYEKGRVISTYIDGTMPFQYDSIFYDHAGNVTKRTRSLIGNPKWFTADYEYDNNPKPNLGIDYAIIFPPFGGDGGMLNLERGLSQNNMTNGRGQVWIYTYNEYGLPETFCPTWESNNPPLDPLILTITYRQIASGISEPAQSKLVVYPNPTRGELRIEVAGQARNDVEIFDIMGRKQKAEGRRQNGEKEMVMDISHLPVGVYFLRVGGETVKVIKN